MKGYIANIEKLTLENNNFRAVLYTARHSQLVLMSLLPGEKIGEEIHKLDQFLRVERGTGKVIIDGVETAIGDGSAIFVPAGAKHNVTNTSKAQPLKLYTIYSPPEHKDGIVRKTRADAMAAEEHFDGQTSET